MSTTPPVTTRTLDYAALVRKVWGEELNQKEIVYLFSNGREFKSTDADVNSGVYPK